MTKQAKIALVSDVQAFKKGMAEAKSVLQGMSDMKINPKISNEFEKAMKTDLAKAADILKGKIEDTEVALKKFGQRGGKVFESKQVQNLIKTHGELNKKLKETETILKSINKEQGETGGGAQGGGVAKKGLGMVGKGLAAIGVTAGVGALYQRGQGLAKQQILTQQLAGAGLGGERSKLGFTRMERLQRSEGISQALGRRTTEEELTGMVNQGEQFTRAFGVDAGQQGQVMKAARKAGVDDQQKFLATSIGDAVTMGLEGSALTEYLGSMTGYLDTMSKGMDINEGSLRGFAGTLGSLPFFSKNPERIFDAINRLDETFKGGDRFQQSQAVQAIRDVGGQGLSASAVEARRGMGLFGGLDKKKDAKLIESLGGEDSELGRSLTTGGKDILEARFKNIFAKTKGMKPAQQLRAFQESTGLKGKAGIEAFAELRKTGGSLSDTTFDKMKEQAGKTPEEIMAANIEKTMKTASGEILDAGTIIDKALNDMASAVAITMATVVKGMGSLGVNLGYLTAATAALTAIQTAGLLSKGGGELGDGLGGLLGGGKSKGIGSLMKSPAAKMLGGVALAGGVGYAAGMGINALDDAYGQGTTDEGFEGGVVERLFFKLDKWTGVFGGGADAFIKAQEALNAGSGVLAPSENKIPESLKPFTQLEKTEAESNILPFAPTEEGRAAGEEFNTEVLKNSFETYLSQLNSSTLEVKDAILKSAQKTEPRNMQMGNTGPRRVRGR